MTDTHAQSHATVLLLLLLHSW